MASLRDFTGFFTGERSRKRASESYGKAYANQLQSLTPSTQEQDISRMLYQVGRERLQSGMTPAERQAYERNVLMRRGLRGQEYARQEASAADMAARRGIAGSAVDQRAMAEIARQRAQAEERAAMGETERLQELTRQGQQQGIGALSGERQYLRGLASQRTELLDPTRNPEYVANQQQYESDVQALGAALGLVGDIAADYATGGMSSMAKAVKPKKERRYGRQD